MEIASEDSQPTSPQDEQKIQVELTPEFTKNLKILAKRYPDIQADIQPVVQDLEMGNFVGDRISNIGAGYVVFKVRIRNRNIQSGKRAGYRLIYQLESPTQLLLLMIYSKSDYADIPNKEVREIVTKFYEDRK
jgi:mRNA-degrading endonuclease RelE of RelBE toxin-antitoxin system